MFRCGLGHGIGLLEKLSVNLIAMYRFCKWNQV